MHTPKRRTLLSASIAAAGAGVLAACSRSDSHPPPGSHSASASPPASAPRRAPGPGGGRPNAPRPGNGFVPKGPKGYINPSDPEVLAAERERGAGPLRRFSLTATETVVDLGGRKVRTWAYGDMVPGEAIRVTAGDILEITLANHLPESTTLHSHGLRLRCDMDGVPGLTQEPIRPGADFTYSFAVPHSGTYLLHSHSGMQPDRGLYAPLIVDDPKEPLSYDKEWIVVLDDWLDGVDRSTPDGVLAQLLDGKHPPMDMGGMGMSVGRGAAHTGAGRRLPNRPQASASNSPGGPSRILRHSRSHMLRSEGGHVAYPYYLVNGRLPHAPSVFRARPGDRIRLRIINAGSDTAFRVALGGHEMTVTHTDGYPVEHTMTHALLVGMAERYDALVTAQDGVFPLVAIAEGKDARALAVLNTGKGRSLPPPSAHPWELDGRTVPAGRFVPQEHVALCDREPDREIRIKLTGGMTKFDWGFDHRPYSLEERYSIRQDERVRVSLINATDMWHPVHLHGHTFAMTGINAVGTRKDTAIVLPHRKVVIDFNADNPGLWMLHCHNQYHSESGMMTILGYRK